MSYLYPYGDTQQLNLAWFLAKFKELYEYISNLNPDDIALTTVLSRFTNEYNSSTNYIPGDYVIHEGFIFKANQSTTGNFNPEAWDAALPVNDIQGLRILLGGISTDITTLEQNAVTNVQYTPGAATADGLLRQTKNGTAETVMTVDKEPTENSQNPVKSGAVQNQINERMLLAPDYTGATDLDSVCNYIKNLIANNESKYRNKLFAFNCTRETGAATGYFNTASFTVICKYSSVNYGYGMMMSDNEKFTASFRTSGGTNYLYETGDLKGSLTSKLFIKSGTISSAHTSSTTTTLATDTSKINANTDIANVWFSNPANVTSDYTIATNASGQVQITCTNSAAVTVYVVLFNP